MKALALMLISASISLASTQSVYRVWHPISLHGTDVSSVPGKESGVDFTVLMSRPVVLSGALPEDLVYAVALHHQLPSIGRYDEKEANLIALCGIKLRAELTHNGLAVTIDTTAAKIPNHLNISLYQVVKLAAKAIRSTLEDYAAAYLHEALSCSIGIVADQKEAQFEQLKMLEVQFSAANGKQ